MRRLLQSTLILLLLLVALAPRAGVAAESTQSVVDADTARQELLDQQGYLAWQRINDARLNPMAVVERLGIPVSQARAALGDEAWILDRGLPPVAWNTQLSVATSAHGRDMFDRLYYSHVTPEGFGPAERIAAAGYQAVNADETLAALVFDSYVDVDVAVDFMIDTMLRDELTATSGVPRNIFSTQLSEMGSSFFAESIPLLEGQPYVYLFVLDFATPLLPQSYLIGAFDAATGRRPLMMPVATGLWSFQPVLIPGFFQVPYPVGGAAFVMVGNDTESISSPVFVNDEGDAEHHFVDLRAVR